MEFCSSSGQDTRTIPFPESKFLQIRARISAGKSGFVHRQQKNSAAHDLSAEIVFSVQPPECKEPKFLQNNADEKRNVGFRVERTSVGGWKVDCQIFSRSIHLFEPRTQVPILFRVDRQQIQSHRNVVFFFASLVFASWIPSWSLSSASAQTCLTEVRWWGSSGAARSDSPWWSTASGSCTSMNESSSL